MADNMDHTDNLDFRKSRLLIIGDLMLDQYWLGATGRISPEAPVPVINVNNRDKRLGGAANCALNAKSLDAQVSLAGIIGQDEHGKDIVSLAQQAGINSLIASCNDEQTITKLRIISHNQQMLRADFEAPFQSANVDSLTENILNNLKDFHVIVLSDYNKGTLNHSRRIIEAANAQNTPVIVDPKGSDFSRYQGAFLLTPNRQEFETVVGTCESQAVMISKARALIQSLSLKALLITLSENGMLLVLENGEHHHFNAKAREVFDVTGAGDTVIATLATAIAGGYSLTEAVNLANTAAGIVVGHLGASRVTSLELKMALESHAPLNSAIMTEEKLRSVLLFEQRLGKTVVFTNGCFDLLHVGHTDYLKEARALGDRLIVAVNDDASIKRLKGETRPINHLADRMNLLGSLSAVDFVIPFSEDTPESLLASLQPDILVKGGDYCIDEVVGADIVKGYGGEVKVLSLQSGRSTTRTIDTIINSHLEGENS